jgi:hypothetical protein
MLKNALFTSGTKFKVVDPSKDSTYGVGTQGFISFIEGLDSSFMNVAMSKVVIIRRGKGGKNRLDFTKMYTPVFPIDHEGFDKAMPTTTGGIRRPYLTVERDMAEVVNVMDIPAIDFLGWACSQARRVRFMSEQCRHFKWPSTKKHPLNAMIRTIDYFEEDPIAYIDQFTSAEYRTQFLNSLRPMLSTMIRVDLIHNKTYAEALATAAEFLQFTNAGGFLDKESKGKKDQPKNEYRFTEDDKMLGETLSHHNKELKQAEKLMLMKQKKS